MMVTITVKSEAIEYVVIELDYKLSRLIDEREQARALASGAIGKYPDKIVEYWDNRQKKLQDDIDECRRIFVELRSVLVGLADNKSLVVIVENGGVE